MAQHIWMKEIQHAVEHGMETIEFCHHAVPQIPENWRRPLPSVSLTIFTRQDIAFRIYDPYREFREASAAGKTIQYRSSSLGGWFNDKPGLTWDFNDSPECYRVKPEIIRYRVAKFCTNGTFWVTTVSTPQQEADNEKQDGFCGWLTDWIEVEL